MRYLFLHAHPDDETLSSAAIIRCLVAAGHECAVLTATRGERGEARPGTVPAGVSLTAHRRLERAAALVQLGATDAGWLGTWPNRAAGLHDRAYRDSGMAWVTPTQAGPGPDLAADSLWLADPAEVAADLAAAVAYCKAEEVVSYDAGGGYGHPDHVRCHEAARRVAGELGLPFSEIVLERGEATAWFDGLGEAERIRAAYRAYPSQFVVSGWDITHVGGQADTIRLAAGLRRVG